VLWWYIAPPISASLRSNRDVSIVRTELGSATIAPPVPKKFSLSKYVDSLLVNSAFFSIRTADWRDPCKVIPTRVRDANGLTVKCVPGQSIIQLDDSSPSTVLIKLSHSIRTSR